jgi:hypothetical protein
MRIERGQAPAMSNEGGTLGGQFNSEFAIALER